MLEVMASVMLHVFVFFFFGGGAGYPYYLNLFSNIANAGPTFT